MTQAQTLEEQADRAAAAGQFEAARSFLEQAVQGPEASPGLWTKLSAMRKVSGDLPGALAAIDKTLALTPLDYSALLSRALLLERMGSPQAGAEFGNALAQVPPDDELPDAVKSAVAHARQKWSEHQAKIEARLLKAVPPDLASPQRAKVERFISNRSRRTRPFHQEASDFHYPGLPEIEFQDPATIPELPLLEAHTDEIRSEFEALIAAEAAEMVPYIQYPERVPLRQWRELNNSRDWTAIHLLQNGKRVEANAKHCPKTMAAIGKMPQPHIAGASPNAMFSLLAPRTRIPPHTGVANTRVVCHLPLIVPSGCGFRVGATTREWTVGEAFAFDDTIEHEAWNDSDQLRVVLIIDLWAPALGPEEREAVAAVIGAAGVSFGGA